MEHTYRSVGNGLKKQEKARKKGSAHEEDGIQHLPDLVDDVTVRHASHELYSIIHEFWVISQSYFRIFPN